MRGRPSVNRSIMLDRPSGGWGGREPPQSSCRPTLGIPGGTETVKSEKKLTGQTPGLGVVSQRWLAGVEELLSRIKRPQAPNYAPARVSIERMLGQKSHTPPDLLLPQW